MKSVFVAVSTVMLLTVIVESVSAQAGGHGSEIFVKRLEKAPVIDGVLSPGEWEGAALETGDWKTFWPAFGQVMPQRTVPYAAYDDNALYFALRCFDTEPDKIRPISESGTKFMTAIGWASF